MCKKKKKKKHGGCGRAVMNEVVVASVRGCWASACRDDAVEVLVVWWRGLLRGRGGDARRGRRVLVCSCARPVGTVWLSERLGHRHRVVDRQPFRDVAARPHRGLYRPRVAARHARPPRRSAAAIPTGLQQGGISAAVATEQRNKLRAPGNSQVHAVQRRYPGELLLRPTVSMAAATASLVTVDRRARQRARQRARTLPPLALVWPARPRRRTAARAGAASRKRSRRSRRAALRPGPAVPQVVGARPARGPGEQATSRRRSACSSRRRHQPCRPRPRGASRPSPPVPAPW